MWTRTGDLAIPNVRASQEFHDNILYSGDRQGLVLDVANFKKR